MIRYVLRCETHHEFEVWFSKGSDFEDQRLKKQILCPVCGTYKVEKAIMSPAISKTSKISNTSNTSESGSDLPALSQERMAELSHMAAKIRSNIEKNCEDVGDKFADEARAIHYGEKEERPIYGQATPKEAFDLNAEGVKIAPLPDVLVPKKTTHLN